MSEAFIDARDQTWDVAIDDAGADRIRREVGLDLKPMRGRQITTDDLAQIKRGIGSTKLVMGAIAALLEPQLTARGLTIAAYNACVDKSAEVRALIAFTRALETYLPGPPLDEILKKVRKNLGEG